MRNFTAGKWEYLEYIPEGITLNGREYLIHSCDGDVALARREEEDARLIAAAPKMYELLNMAMWSLRYHSDNDGIIACHIGELLASIDGDFDVKTQEAEP